MPELDIDASAREVADLLNQGQIRQAAERLETLRQNQALVVQESLDRLVAVRARDRLTAPGVIAADERVGPIVERLRTATASPRFPAETETRDLSQAQLHDVYGSMVASRGNQAARDSLDTNNERVILGLRNETQTTVRHGVGAYDDRLVVVWKDHLGVRHAREFNEANTEPSAQYDHHAGSDGTRRYAEGGQNAPPLERSLGYEQVSRRKIEGEDVNRDGVRDLGRLGEGTTEMLATTHPAYARGRQNGTEFALRPSPEAVTDGTRRVQRDSNADGWFTAADVNGVQDLNNTFKIHRGSGGESRNTDSAGCQTIRGGQYDEFIAEVRRNPQQDRWQYVLTSVGAGQQPQQERALPNEGQPPLPQPPEAARPLPPRRPDDPEHTDHGLHRQIQDRVGALGPGFHENREQLSMSLLAEAKARGLSQVDHLFPNHATATLKPGEHLFLVQGRPNDPAAQRAMVNTAAASNTPVEESLSRIESLNQAVASTTVIDQQNRNVTQDTPSIRLG
ncbi:XVIPCD domain-containing protein [Pseudoxanthomonas sp. CF125]|uniref:XVIPCD domain-containing protein n=1 Tax=Pseudoxanthomonas sp. CF125 TaxID=1855303 RepID=UPI00088BCA42|nr:XVIPCD domain-containing protein [Pseudoxanthomonas sp. CF125]SDR23214.1 hypothetical protein SAMN05216569_3754 [Pseudoxanthomonas sp. CF125]